MALAIAANLMGYWVSGKTYDATVADRDQWKGIALKALHVGEQVAAQPRIIGMQRPLPAPVPPSADIDTVKARVAELEGKK